MTNSLIISSDLVNEGQLFDLVTVLQRTMGAKIRVTRYFEVTSDSEPVLQALGALFGQQRQPLLNAPAKKERPELPKHEASSAGITVGDLPFRGETPADLASGHRSLAEIVASERKPVVKAEKPVEKKPIVRSWRVEDPGNQKNAELINGWEKNRRLDKGEFEEGTILRHPSGAFVVHGARGGQQFVKPFTGARP